jgi:rod shape-determining protein MreC
MLEFFRTNRVVVTSGALLLLSLLLLSASVRTQRKIDPLTGALLEGIRPLQVGVAGTAALVRKTWRRYVMVIAVARENDQLRRRVQELEQEVVRLGEAQEAVARLNALLGMKEVLDGPAQAAQIIGRDPSPWFGTVTINKGEADGVTNHLAVVAPQGVIGQTVATTAHSARVLLITDHNSGVDAVVQRSRARGIVQGALDGGCVMKYLKREDDVAEGDRVVTSGLDGIFPRGVTIGVVTRVSRGNRGLLQVADVSPAAPLDRLEEVLVVDHSTRVREQVP